MLRAYLREPLELSQGSRRTRTRTAAAYFIGRVFPVFGASLDFKPSDRPRRNDELSARGFTGTLGAFPCSLVRVLYANLAALSARTVPSRYMCPPVSSSTDRVRTGLGILEISASPRGSSFGDRLGIHGGFSDSAMFRRGHVIARDRVWKCVQIHWCSIFDRHRSISIACFRSSDPLILRHPVYLQRRLD